MGTIESTTDTATPARGARPARDKSQGQWAAGHREPLNANEKFKQSDDALNVRARIVEKYAKEGFASIPGEDLRGRMRWMGMYTQRKPGIDGGKTAILEPHELDDEYFMMRVRLDGGQVSIEQLRAIADVATLYARDTCDVTDRQNLQLHWIRIEDVPAIWERLESVGLTTLEACGDCPRVVLGSPVAGLAADEVLDATPAIAEIVRRAVGNPDFSNLPRKFKSAVSGLQDVAHEINDVSFVGVVHPEHGPGFDVFVGGGLSTNPMIAQRLGAWVPLEEVADVYCGVLGVFRDWGYRRLRNRARIKFLVADWGPEKFRQILEDDYLGKKLIDGPPPPTLPAGVHDHIGVHPQKDGNYWVGFAPMVGRISGTLLNKIGDLPEEYGTGRLRTTVEQKLLILDVPADRTSDLVVALEALDLQVRPTPFRRQTMACTGIEFCKLAIVETKGRAAALVRELEKRLPEFDAPLTINMNGCPNACARFQTADIGLKGMLVTDDDGRQVEGYQVHLGGGLGLTLGFGRKVRGLKVTTHDLDDYVERVLRRYLSQRTDGEAFAAWVQRAEEADLS